MLTYPLPDEDIVYHCAAAEYDSKPDKHACHDGRCRVELDERIQDDAYKLYMQEERDSISWLVGSETSVLPNLVLYNYIQDRVGAVDISISFT